MWVDPRALAAVRTSAVALRGHVRQRFGPPNTRFEAARPAPSFARPGPRASAPASLGARLAFQTARSVRLLR